MLLSIPPQRQSLWKSTRREAWDSSLLFYWWLSWCYGCISLQCVGNGAGDDKPLTDVLTTLFHSLSEHSGHGSLRGMVSSHYTKRAVWSHLWRFICLQPQCYSEISQDPQLQLSCAGSSQRWLCCHPAALDSVMVQTAPLLKCCHQLLSPVGSGTTDKYECGWNNEKVLKNHQKWRVHY